MSEEGRLSFEKAMARLAESSAQHDERLAAIEQTNQRHERTTQTLSEVAAAQQRLMANMRQRTKGLEESRVMLVEMLRSHHETLHNHDDAIAEMRAARANLDAKMAALADAQILTEEHVRTALRQLAESQAHTDRRLDALIDIVRGGRGGQSEGRPE